MSCTCDQTYICAECQLKIDVANQQRYFDELSKWIIESLQTLARFQEVDLPEPPEKPGSL